MLHSFSYRLEVKFIWGRMDRLARLEAFIILFINGSLVILSGLSPAQAPCSKSQMWFCKLEIFQSTQSSIWEKSKEKNGKSSLQSLIRQHLSSDINHLSWIRRKVNSVAKNEILPSDFIVEMHINTARNNTISDGCSTFWCKNCKITISSLISPAKKCRTSKGQPNVT